MTFKPLCLSFLLVLPLTSQQEGEWSSYGRDAGGSKFSPLKGIDRKNVRNLKVAWTYHTGDLYQPKNGKPAALEVTPLFIDNTLFISTPLGRVAALEPESGNQRWSYDPKINREGGYGDFANRGVSTWYDKE